ncbi:MAG: hypothetical protein EXQ90_04290 [Rhodospirillales bacterium]|nr:hypothetical protein [Rhodospirillales bacterium]
MNTVDPDRSDILLVCSDWLLWQDLRRRGTHAVFAPAVSVESTTKSGDSDIYNSVNDWVYLNGQDATRFRGVSLGRKFVFPIAMLLSEHIKLAAALDALTRRYGPSQYIYRDYRTDRSNLDPDDRQALVNILAARHGVDVINRRDPVADDEQVVPALPHARWALLGRGSDARRWRTRIEKWMVRFLDFLARCRLQGARSRKRVLIAATALTSVPLIDGRRAGDKAIPMIVGRWLPNKRDARLFFRRLRKGLLPVDAPASTLDRSESDFMNMIEHQFAEAWRHKASNDIEILRGIVRKYVLASKRLAVAAAEVKWAEGLLARWRPDGVLTDGLQNSMSMTLLEVARRHNIPTAAMWHSPHYHDVKLDVFGSDLRSESLAAAALTWGVANESWLERTRAQSHIVRTGSVAAAQYQGMVAAKPHRRRALLLQYNLSFVDTASWYPQQEYEVFVAASRLLTELAIQNVRLRCHPTDPRAPYYRRIIKYFDLQCEISVGNSYYDDLVWADFVVGPAASGAMVEALAARRHYYPVLIPPHSVDMTHLRGAVYEDLESLEAALKRGDPPPEQERLREAFTSLGEIPDPAQRAWDVLVEMASQAR